MGWRGEAGRRGFRPSVKDIKNPAASGDTQLSSILLLKCLQNLIHLACHLISPWKLGHSLPPICRQTALDLKPMGFPPRPCPPILDKTAPPHKTSCCGF